MFSRGISSVLSKVLARPSSRDQSLSFQATHSSLSDPLDVGLTDTWSDTTLYSAYTRPGPTPTPSIRPTPTPSRSSPSLSSITTGSSLVKGHPDYILGSDYTSSSSSKSLLGLERSISSFRERDELNEPLNALVRPVPPPAEVVQSTYGRRLPMLLYKTESTSSAPSRSFRYQTPLTSPRSPFLTLPPSPTSSTRTRPLFLPSPSPAPLQLEETHTDDSSTRKRKDYPAPLFDALVSRPKRHRTDLDIIDIDDDGDDNDDDDDWSLGLIDTGYQGHRTAAFSAERTPTLDPSVAYSKALESDEEGESWMSTNQRPSTPLAPAPPRDAIAWLGQEGGAIKFKTKPANFNDKAFSRWSYSATGPKSSAVSERTDGDIHFSPSNGIGTNEPFNYWVCVRNERVLRWVDYSCGQPHPVYVGYVLKPVNVVTKAPPKWVKAASYKASRD